LAHRRRPDPKHQTPNIASNLGAQIDPKDIDYIEVQRGSYTSDVGDRTYGVFNVVPRTGFERNREAELVLSAGNFFQTNDQINFGDHSEKFAYYASLNGNRSDYGLAPPVGQVLHDATNGYGGFASFIYNRTPEDQFRLVMQLRQDYFQIPYDPDPNSFENQQYDSSGLRDGQHETDGLAAFSWVHTFNPSTVLQVSPFFHYNKADYESNPNDVPVATTVNRSSTYGGGQTSITTEIARNTLQAGFYSFGQHDNYLFGAIFNDGSGSPNFSTPDSASGGVIEEYVSDNYKATSWLTLIAGLRQTHFQGQFTENETDPRFVRNIQVFEDGFPVTQPDGLARTDLTDPHAYSSIDVVEGPSSTLYGNYATGGAINFHTRTGGEIQGLELGADFGNFGYFNDYVTYGVGGERYQVSGFLSNVRATQATANNSFNTITANILATFVATPKDRFTIKFIDNDLDTNLSIRLSRTQYQMNPLQKGCEVYTAAASANGCASISLFTNGYNGTKVSLTAAQVGLGRHDRRTIFGARYEHDLTDNMTWRTQFVFDNRDANQPTSSSTYRGTLPSFNVVSDVLRRVNLWSRHSSTFAGGFFNYENINSLSANLVPGGNAALGGQTQTAYGKHLNTGIRARQEIALAERWMLVAGLGAEYTGLNALANNFTYPIAATPVISPVSADRTFFNVAPEVSHQYHPTDRWRLYARLGTGYGTPQATQLFTNAQGAFGNNTTLKTHRNTGVDLGADWSLGATLQASITGFYEWFHNEMVTQSPGVNLQSYTFNAPASAHRGVEVGLDWHPSDGLARSQAACLLHVRQPDLYQLQRNNHHRHSNRHLQPQRQHDSRSRPELPERPHRLRPTNRQATRFRRLHRSQLAGQLQTRQRESAECIRFYAAQSKHPLRSSRRTWGDLSTPLLLRHSEPSQ